GPASSKGKGRARPQDILTIHTPHPAALFRLTFLVTAVTKRDPTVPALNVNVKNDAKEKPAQDPKRRKFAREGVAVADKAPPVQCALLTFCRDPGLTNDSPQLALARRLRMLVH